MKVFLTGGTGFVGSEVLRQLVAGGHQVRALVRKGSEGKLAVTEGVEVCHGDVLDTEAIASAMEGCEAVINLVGIIREYPSRGITFEKLHYKATCNLVAAAENKGISRYIQMSANGVGEGAENDYLSTKWAAEEALRASKLDWTIFRPSVIFGAGGEFVSMLADMVRKLPVVPVIGDGKYRMAPVAVQDVARSFVASLEMPETVGGIYQLCGPESYSYNEILDLIGAALGISKVRKLNHPLFIVKKAVGLFENLDNFPITSTQLSMLLAGNVCDSKPWAEIFNLEPLSFADGVRGVL